MVLTLTDLSNGNQIMFFERPYYIDKKIQDRQTPLFYVVGLS